MIGLVTLTLSRASARRSARVQTRCPVGYLAVLSAQVLSSRVGSPYQPFICMKYINVLWLNVLGDYLHRYPCNFKSESSPLRRGVSTQIIRNGVEIFRMGDADHLPN